MVHLCDIKIGTLIPQFLLAEQYNAKQPYDDKCLCTLLWLWKAHHNGDQFLFSPLSCLVNSRILQCYMVKVSLSVGVFPVRLLAFLIGQHRLMSGCVFPKWFCCTRAAVFPLQTFIRAQICTFLMCSHLTTLSLSCFKSSYYPPSVTESFKSTCKSQLLFLCPYGIDLIFLCWQHVVY